MKKIIYIFALLALSGCGYKFNGASTDGIKTVNVQIFENVSPLVVANLSNDLTEAFKDRIRTQSRLNIVQGEADVRFEGRITNYSISPIAIQDNSNPVAGANRMSITVAVKYINNSESKTSQSFEESFTAFEDFALGGQSLQSQEQRLIKLVIPKLTENIFNRAFAQW